MSKEYTLQYKIEVMREALPTRETLAHALAVSFGILLCLYLYFVIAITFNIVDRKTVTLNIKEQTSQVSLLEASYTNQVGQINQQLAVSMGLTEPVKTQFAMRKSDVVVSFAR